MHIVEQKAELISNWDYDELLRIVEYAGRTCYKSEPKADTREAKEKFIKMIIGRGHESVIEHANITFKLTTTRGVSHQIARHRHLSISQESTRYCDYTKDRFNGELTMISPFKEEGTDLKNWKIAMVELESAYKYFKQNGIQTDIAREVLPTCLKTEMVITCNMRELRHILKLRTSRAAHPQARVLFKMLYDLVKEKYPVFVSDINL